MNKLKKIFANRNLPIIIVLAILVIALIIIKIITPKEEPIVPETVLPTLTPIQTVTILPGKGDPDFRQSLEPIIKKNYPLFDFVPFKTEFWSIYYLSPLKLRVNLSLDNQENRQEVLDWITSKGVDPNTHQIKWEGLNKN